MSFLNAKLEALGNSLLARFAVAGLSDPAIILLLHRLKVRTAYILPSTEILPELIANLELLLLQVLTAG